MPQGHRARGRCGVARGCVARRQRLQGDTAPIVIPPDREAQFLRYHHVEKWPIGTTARQLSVHHIVVRRVLAQAGMPRTATSPRPSRIKPFLPFIRQTLEMFPTLTASRLYTMVRERGW
jgi:hypothetical protein